jgi:hypothetical protein
MAAVLNTAVIPESDILSHRRVTWRVRIEWLLKQEQYLSSYLLVWITVGSRGTLANKASAK